LIDMIMRDEDVREAAWRMFKIRFVAKFNKGIKEHNPNGDRGMIFMTSLQLIRAAQEECIDQWAYLFMLEMAEMRKEGKERSRMMGEEGA